jgi:hypothetical protein
MKKYEIPRVTGLVVLQSGFRVTFVLAVPLHDSNFHEWGRPTGTPINFANEVNLAEGVVFGNEN